MSQRFEQQHAERQEDGVAAEEARWPGKRTMVDAAMAGAPGEAPNAQSDPRRPDIARIRSAIGSLDAGEPLDDASKAQYGAQLGIDLSSVKVHHDSAAAAELGVTGFTHGDHIAFAPGVDLSSEGGQHVLAHELVHVAQNMSAGGEAMEFAARLDVGPSNSPVEQQAEAGAAALTSGQSFRASGHANLPGISFFEGPIPGDKGPGKDPPPGPSPQPQPAPKAPPQPPAPKGGPQGPGPKGPTPTPTPTQGPTIGPARPQGPTIGPARPTPKPAPAPTPTPSLDARVLEELEKRADPALAGNYTKACNQIDILRIQAVQYSFQPTGVLNVIGQSLFPWEALKQHGREVSLTNPYDSGSLQAWIEGARGVIRILGDVAAWVSTIADIVAAVSGLLAVISSWTGAGLAIFGTIAVIAAEVGLIAGLIKIVLDIIDAIISVVQMILLVQKIKASKDPSERAKLAALLGREVKEFSSTVTGVVVQVGTIVVTAGLAAGVGSLFAKSLKKLPGKFIKELAGEFGPLFNARKSIDTIKKAAARPIRTPKAAVRETADPASITPKEIADGAVTVRRVEITRERIKIKGSRAKRKGKPTQWREVVKVTEKPVLRPKDLKIPKGDKTVKREVRFIIDPSKLKRGIPIRPIRNFVKDASAVPPGQVAGQGQANAKKVGDPITVQKPTAQLPDGEASAGSTPLTKVAMWPSQLDHLKATKQGLGPANDRLMTMYNLAKGQAGAHQTASLEKVFGGVKNNAGQMRLTALQTKGDATEGQANSDKGANTAKQGQSQKTNLDGKQSQLDGSVNKVGGQKVEKPPAKEGGNILERAKNFLYNQTIGRLGDAVSGLQNWITKSVGGWVMAKSGLTKEELDMAGIENSMRADHQKDKQSEEEMKAAEAESKKIDPALAELMKTATQDEQLAMQAMVESQELMTALDEASSALDQAIAEGTAYMAAVTPMIRHELETQQDGKAIDAAYVEPVVGTANSFKGAVGGDDLASAPAQDAIGELEAAKREWPELEIGTGVGQINAAKTQFAADHRGLVTEAQGACDAAITKVQSLVGTTDYAGVLAAAQALEAAADAFAKNEEKCVENYVFNLDQIIDAHVELLQSAITQQEVDVDVDESQTAPDENADVPAPPQANQPAPPQDPKPDAPAPQSRQVAPPPPAADPIVEPTRQPVQRKAANGGTVAADDPSAVAAQGTAGAGAPLPHLGAIQQAFGRHDVGGVQAHVGGPAAAASQQLGASAYATGDKVAFAGAPDLHTAAHEAAHVVQQRGGVSLKGNVDGGASDPHEQHADQVADAVVSGKSAEGLLDQGGGGAKPGVQRKVDPQQPPPQGKGDKKDKDDPNAPKPDVAKKKGGEPDPSPDAKKDAKADEKGGKGKGGAADAKADAKGGDKQAPKPGAPKAEPKDKGGGDQVAPSGGKQGAVPQGRNAAPADIVQAPAIQPIQPIQLDAPKPSKKVADKWIQETGRDPLAHHAQITAALDDLSNEVNAKQAELQQLGDTAATKVTQDIAAKVDGFKTTVIATGKQRVVTAYGGVGKSLEDSEKKAIADIAAAKKAGETQIKTSRTTKSGDLKAKFTKAKQGNEQLVAKNAPLAAAAIKRFAAGVKPFVDKAKADAITLTTAAAEAHDPKAHDGTSITGGQASLDADILKNHTLQHGKKLGAQYEAKLTGIAKEVDKSALAVTTDALKLPKEELDVTIDVITTASEKNLDAAATQATLQLETTEKSSTKAVADAKVASQKKIETEKTTSVENADKAGKQLADDATAAGGELSSRIKKRVADDTKNYQALVTDIQKGLKKGGPHKYEDIAPKIADAKQRLAAGHTENVEGLNQLVTTGTTELGVTLQKQQGTYDAAIKEQEEQAKKVSVDVAKEVGKSATDMTGSLAGLATVFDETVTKETAKIDAAVADFNAQANAALADFEKQVTQKLEDTRVKLDQELALSLQPEQIKKDVEPEAKKEFKKKETGLIKDASALREAMDGWGTGESAIYAVLRKLGYGEIEYLEALYDEHYSNRGGDGLGPLRYDLKDELDSSELAIATAYLNHDRTTAIRLELADSTGFFNDDEERIEDVLRGASEEEIKFLNTDPAAKAAVANVRSALGGADLDVMDTLLDQSMTREDRNSKANAVRLFEAMDGIGTDEAKIKQLLEQAATPEERARLRAHFNAYAKTKPIAYMEGWAGGSGKEGDDMLDRALGEELSGGELTLATTLAKTERNEQDVKLAKIIEGADGGGTNEDQIFDALDDEEYAAKWKAAKDAGDTKEMARLEAERVKMMDERMKALGSDEGIQSLLDGEMQKSYITYDEFLAGVRKDGKPVTDADRKFLMDVGSGYLEWMVAQRKLQTGAAEPELQLAYACWGVSGTHEEMVNKVLSRGGEPLPIGDVKAICAAFERVWKVKLVDRYEIDLLDEKFPDPGGLLSAELGGKDWNKTRVLLCGQPVTAPQLRYVRKLQMKYATSGLLGGALMDVGEAIGFTEAKSTMEHTEKKFDEKYEELKKQYGDRLSTTDLADLGEKGEELERFGAYLEQDVEAYNKALSSIVDTVVAVLEIVGGIIVTVLTAGTASPVLAAIIGNLIVSAGTIAFKYAALGDQYGAGDLAKDIATAAISAGFAGLGEVKALTKLSDAAAKKTTGVFLTTVTDGVNKGGGRLLGGSIELSAKGVETVNKIVSSGVKNVILSSGQEVANFVADEKTYEMKLGEALWGENSIGARLAKGAPKAFVEGAVKQWIDESAGVSNKDNRGGHKTAGANMIANALSDAGANVAGFFVYLDNYNDAGAFWDELLKSSAKKAATGFMQGYGMHKMRAKKSARDFMNGELGAAELADMLKFLDAREQKELADFVKKHDPAKFNDLPDQFKAAAGGPPAAQTNPSSTTTPVDTQGVDSDDAAEQQKPLTDQERRAKAEEEARRVEAEKAEAEKKRLADEEARLKADADRLAKEKAEADRIAKEKAVAEEQARLAREAEEAKRKEQEELQRRQREAEELKKQKEIDEARKQEEERLRVAAERKKQEEEQKRIAAEAEAKRQAEEAKRQAEVEAKRKAEAERIKREEDAAWAQKRAQDEAKKQAEIEAAHAEKARQDAEQAAKDAEAKQGTKKPPEGDEELPKKPVAGDEEPAKKPVEGDEEVAKKPGEGDEEVAKKPGEGDEEVAKKPGEGDEELAKKPDDEEGAQTTKPKVVTPIADDMPTATARKDVPEDVPVDRAELRKRVAQEHASVIDQFANIPHTQSDKFDDLIADLKKLKPGELGHSDDPVQKAANKERDKAILAKWGEISKTLEKPVGIDEGQLRTLYNTVEQQSFNKWQDQIAHLPKDQQAKLLHMYREELKDYIRDLMLDDRSKEVLRLRDLAVYGSRRGPTFDDLFAKEIKAAGGDADKAYDAIIGSSKTSNKGVNQAITGNEKGIKEQAADQDGKPIKPTPSEELGPKTSKAKDTDDDNDNNTPPTAIKKPVTADEQQSADQLETGVAKLKDTFSDEIAKKDTKLTPPPADRPVLQNTASDALIGLPTNVISPTANADDAMALLKKQGIPRWGALTAKERMHETAFASTLEQNLEAMVTEFHSRSYDDKTKAHIFEVDGAKKLYAAYGAGKSPASDGELDVRATANHALHPAAVAIARIAFLKRLDAMASMPDGPNKAVFVTNGGCASGKGSLTDIVKNANGGKFEFGAVWDAAGEGDASENGWILAAAKARGIKVTYGFVESDPTVTYNGVLDRAESTGRIVDPVTFVRSYTKGQENMRAFMESPEYKAAVASGEVSAVGVFTGKFDMETKSFPQKRLLGDEGKIGAEDINKGPDEAQVTEKAIKIFEEWLAKQKAAGKKTDHWEEGGIVNPLKFGSTGDEATPSDEGPQNQNTASPIKNSDFHGQGRTRAEREARADVTQAQTQTSAARAVEILGGSIGKGGTPDTAIIAVPGKPAVTVRVVVGDATDNVADHDYKHDPANPQTEVIVRVSRKAREEDLARAIAHELAEVRALIEQPERGATGKTSLEDRGPKDAGAVQPQDLTHHDIGRAAELEVLMRDLADAERGGDAAKAKTAKAEIELLLKHMGLEPGGLGANKNARALVGADKVAEIEAVLTRVDTGAAVRGLAADGVSDETVNGTLDTATAKLLADAEALKTERESGKAKGNDADRLSRREKRLRDAAKELADAKGLSGDARNAKLVEIGRKYNLAGMQSLEELGAPGHGHDSKIYEIVSELAGDIIRRAETPGAADPKSMTAVLEPFRQAYDAALAGGANPFTVNGQSFVVRLDDGYVFPAALGSGHELDSRFGYNAHDEKVNKQDSSVTRSPENRHESSLDDGAGKQQSFTFRTMTAEQLAQVARDLANGVKVSDDVMCIFIASMVAEANRDLASQVTNRLVLGDQDGKDKPVFAQLPMTTGGTITEPRDRTLDDSRGGSALAAGKVTDAQIAMVKATFEKAEGMSLDEFISKNGGPDSPAVRAKIKSVLEAAMLERL